MTSRVSRRLRCGLVPLLALVLGPATGCTPAGPDLMLVSIEALRVDRLGPYGGPSGATPRFDALARDGVVFEHAHTPSPSTLPSAATLLSGLGPHLHGVRDDLRYRLRPEIPSVAERLLAAGYSTAAFVGARSLHGSFGLARGFVVYDDDIAYPLDAEVAAAARRDASAVTERALAWLRKRSRSPVFLWVHYADLRAPRSTASLPGAGGDAYSAAVAALDAELGRLLEGIAAERGERGRVLVVAATQAEALGEHGESGHGWLANETTLHVPLIAVGPEFPPGRRATAWVGTEDVAGTLLAAAGLDDDSRSEGLRVALDRAPGEDAPSWFEAFAPSARLGWRAISGVRAGRWKYVAEPAPASLYDVVDDPGETRDRSADAPERVANLAAAHSALAASMHSSAAETLDDRDARIALFGHLPGAPLHFDASPPDPRSGVGAISWVERAFGLAGAGRVADSAGALELLSKNPVARPLALRRLGTVLLLSDRADDAVGAFSRLETLTGSAHARVSLAAAQLAGGRGEAALGSLARVSEDRPVLSSRALLMRGYARLATDRAAPALEDATALLARRPGDDAALALASSARTILDGEEAELARLRRQLGDAASPGEQVQTRLALSELLVGASRDREAAAVLEADPDPGAEVLAARAAIADRRDNPARAARLYEEALSLRPSSRHFHLALASLYERLGRWDEAARLYSVLLEARPSDVGLHVARGTARLRSGRPENAEGDYRTALALDPEVPEAHYDLALIALARGDEDGAEHGLQRAVALRPGFSAAHLELSRLYHRRGDPRSAEHAALAVEGSDPTQGLH